MIAPELSYYPTPSSAGEEALLLEQESIELARRRDSAAVELGRASILAITGGLVESSAYEQPIDIFESEKTTITRRTFGSAALKIVQLNPELLASQSANTEALHHQEIIQKHQDTLQFAA